jgi:hypothetical protein
MFYCTVDALLCAHALLYVYSTVILYCTLPYSTLYTLHCILSSMHMLYAYTLLYRTLLFSTPLYIHCIYYHIIQHDTIQYN